MHSLTRVLVLTVAFLLLITMLSRNSTQPDPAKALPVKFVADQNSVNPDQPNPADDLPGKVVAVQDPMNPEQLIFWYFDKEDDLQAKVIDQRKEGHKDVYYVELTANSKADAKLTGIAELYYVTIAKKQYLVGVGSINLKMSLTRSIQKTPPDNSSPTAQPAQRPPGG